MCCPHGHRDCPDRVPHREDRGRVIHTVTATVQAVSPTVRTDGMSSTRTLGSSCSVSTAQGWVLAPSWPLRLWEPANLLAPPCGCLRRGPEPPRLDSRKPPHCRPQVVGKGSPCSRQAAVVSAQVSSHRTNDLGARPGSEAETPQRGGKPEAHG